MKKIVMLSLFPAFLSADFANSVINGVGQGIGNAVGTNLANSRWLHYSAELSIALGGVSKPKYSEMKPDSNSSTSDSAKISIKKLDEHSLFKAGVGIKGYTSLGSQNVQIGGSFGAMYYFNRSVSADLGLFLFLRYSCFFSRLSVGVQAINIYFDEEGKYDAKRVLLGGGLFSLQFGYIFYEVFYVAISASYSLLSNYDTGHSQQFENLRYEGSLKRFDDIIKNRSFAVHISVGMLFNGYSENLRTSEETARAQELAKLEAKEEFKRRQKKRQEDEKKQEADKASYEEYQRYLRSKKDRANA